MPEPAPNPAPPQPVAAAEVDAPPPLRWREVSAAQGSQLHFDIHFQGRASLWACEGRRCAVVHGTGTGSREVKIPCDADRYPTQFSRPSKSGRWLLQTCAEGTFVTDLDDGRSHVLDLGGGERPYAGVIDDAGTATLATAAPMFVRVALEGRAREFPVHTPANAVGGGHAGLVPAHGPWLGFSDGAYAREVGWLSDAAAEPVALGGGAFFNGTHVWVSLMTNRYVTLRPDGSQVGVTGRFGGGLPGKGLLMSIQAWGDEGLVIEYEDALVLLDAQLEHVAQIDLPDLEGMPDVGSDPAGTRLHVASPDGARWVMSLPPEIVVRASGGRVRE